MPRIGVRWRVGDHLGQVGPSNRLYSPDPATYARAEGTLGHPPPGYRSQERGALVYKGEMIDEAHRKLAEAVAPRGRRLGLDHAADRA
jgi:citrate lyase subunit beta/citryl-CoA lyase